MNASSNTAPFTADRLEPPRIAVIGAGIAGSACAAGLLRVGFDVTVFDKSRGVGGRLATRHAQWADGDGIARSAAFDHGCPNFTVTRPRFQAVVERAVAVGVAARWQQRVHADFPAARLRDVVVPAPNMPAFCRHLLNGVPLRLGHAVTSLQRGPGGWMLQLAEEPPEGPFAQVVLAIPAAQAAVLLEGHRDDWADALGTVPMSPCWTLMAVTDDLDWPWDAAQISRGELAWVERNDRAPGRGSAGGVPWVAHATPAWSLAHLEDEPARVVELLSAALGRSLTSGAVPRWHHAGVHRWQHAQRAQPARGSAEHWWATGTGLGVCGDAFGDGSVEAAWASGDGLASALMASRDTFTAAVLGARAGTEESLPTVRRRRLASFLPLSNTTTGESPWVALDAHS